MVLEQTGAYGLRWGQVLEDLGAKVYIADGKDFKNFKLYQAVRKKDNYTDAYYLRLFFEGVKIFPTSPAEHLPYSSTCLEPTQGLEQSQSQKPSQEPSQEIGQGLEYALVGGGCKRKKRRRLES